MLVQDKPQGQDHMLVYEDSSLGQNRKGIGQDKT